MEIPNDQGIYVVEDTQTSYWSKLGGYDKPNQNGQQVTFKI